MNVENLHVGMVVKNYKELCKLLEVEEKGGKSRKLQVTDWERFFKSHKQGQKFIIDEIYDAPKEKISNRGKAYKESNLMQDRASELYTLVIDKIDNLTIYNNSDEVHYKCVNCEEIDLDTPLTMYKAKGKCKSCRMSTFARKLYKILLKSDLNILTEYTFDNLKSASNYPLRFDFALFKDGKLIGLIEYDGEYHDENEIIMKHDKLKDDYCKVNSIPLLRIHHTEKNTFYKKLYAFLLHFDLPYKELEVEMIRSIIKDTEMLGILQNDDSKRYALIENLKQLNLMEDF